MAHTHITGSAYVATVDSIGSDIELGIFKYITTPRIFAQDVEPPTGPITTGDTVTSITKLIAPGTYRVVNAQTPNMFPGLSPETTTISVHSSFTSFYRLDGSPGWVVSNTLTAGMKIAGLRYNSITGKYDRIAEFTITSVADTYFPTWDGCTPTFANTTPYKALFANRLYVKIGA